MQLYFHGYLSSLLRINCVSSDLYIWADNATGNRQFNNSESPEESEQFGGNRGKYAQLDSIFEKFNQQGMARQRPGSVNGASSERMHDLEETYDTLTDGMDGKLMNAATYFEFDVDEIEKEDYAFRYDANFPLGSKYDVKVSWITMPNFYIFSLILDVCIYLILSRVWGHQMFYVQIDVWCSDKLYTCWVGGIAWNIMMQPTGTTHNITMENREE